MHAFIAAGLEATAFGSAKAGPVIGHVLLALADPAPGSSRWPCAGRAEVIMLMAKDRRQPPSIPHPGIPGSGRAQARLARLRRAPRDGWDRLAEQTSP
jgi:hypothetical protein